MGDQVTVRRWAWLSWVVVALLLAATAPVLADVSTQEDVRVLATQDQAVTFVITAEDTDIDPYALIFHPILFELAEGPAHGAVVGGLQDVHYELPDKASVTVTYQPAAGFVGKDALTIKVIDPDDNDSELVTVTIEVSKSRGVQRFSGTWDAEMAFDLPSNSFSVFGQRFTALYRVDLFALKGIADFALDWTGGSPAIAFDALRFEASATVGDLNASGTLAFDPNAVAPSGVFDYALTNVSGHIGEVFVAHMLYLTDPLVQSYQAISIQGSVAGFAFGNTMRLNMTDDCAFVFSRNDTQIRWDACGAGFHAALSISDAGFQTLSFGADGIAFPAGAGLLQGITLDAGVTFATTEKTLSLSMDWQPGTWFCVRLFGELEVGGAGLASIDAISLYGVVAECDVANGVHVKSATSLVPAKNLAITGLAAYFEVFAISGDLASCCSTAGTWSVATYFKHPSVALFDWGETLAAANVVLSDQLTVGGTLTVRAIDAGDPTVEIALSWEARW